MMGSAHADYTGHGAELGRTRRLALVFEHDPDAERLDRFLERGSADGPDLATRIELLRQLVEALNYAQERRVYHRGLHPQKVLVTAPDTNRPKLKIFDWGTGEDGSPRDGTSTRSASRPR